MIRGFSKLRIFVSGLLLLLICAFSVLTLAAEPSSAPAAPPGYLQYQEPARAGSSTVGTIAYVFSLVVMFLGVIVLAYLASRFIAAKMGGIGQSPGSSIHMTLALGPNRNIHLVEMAGRFFVVGVTEQSIRLLFEIDSPDQIALIRDSTSTAKPSFEEALGSQLSALKQIRERFPAVFSQSGGSARNDDNEKR
jgi:flagellar protein FliO/FliZ